MAVAFGFLQISTPTNEDRMPSSVTRLFSEADRARIQAAVHDAEGKTSGEIVPFVVERSDGYEAADWRGGALLGTVDRIVLLRLCTN